MLAGLRVGDRTLRDARVVIVGAGAAGIGIARLLRTAMGAEGMSEQAIRDHLALVDTHGLVHDGRGDLDAAKREFAVASAGSAEAAQLVHVVVHRRPTILVGATGVSGTFSEDVIRAMAAGLTDDDRPIVLPLSNPTSVCEADPADVIRWTDGRAVVATGSPFAPVEHRGSWHEIGQANNVFIFPGLGLGAIVTEARAITDSMFLLAARELAASVSDERLATGALYPAVADLRAISRRIALAVGREAVAEGQSVAADRAGGSFDTEAAVDAAMWWPDYVPYRRGSL